MIRPRSNAAAALVALASLTLASAASAQEPQQPQGPQQSEEPVQTPQPEGECQQFTTTGICRTTAPVVVPGTPRVEPPSGEPTAEPVGGRDGSAVPNYSCDWITVPETPELRAEFPDAPPDAMFEVYECRLAVAEFGLSQNLDGRRAERWVLPDGSEPAQPVPGALAATIYVSVQAAMQAPALASDPPVGVAAIVNAPVFVEVTNWQPEIVQSECALGVCVTMTATPTLTFDPGDGSAPITCEPPGSRYVPGGPPMAEQAEGACAHTYRRRTGVDDRPAEWPGAVSVTWDVSWTSTVGGSPGPSGSYAPVTLSTALPRAVEEVAAVVVGADP